MSHRASEHGRDTGAQASESAVETVEENSAAASGAWNSYVQALQAKGDLNGADVQAKAAEGVSGGGGSLPHGEAIQASFGHHDVSGVSAHVGGKAADAAGSIGAEAYATGSSVAFAKSPDLHTAAHEAAHVVQQRGGVQLKGGVGQAGDTYEQHADAVADLVVQGKSSEGLLDTMSGGTQTHAVQKREGEGPAKPKKTVSSAAAKRVSLAWDAIAHTKSVMAFGAGNQKEALELSKFNSYYRMKVMRDPACWELADSVRAIASANSEALTAAKADLAQGGNCGEHARVAFDYLRVHAAGEIINRSDVEGLDHAFVLMGDVAKESDDDICVSDPWPTAATACIWSDHFAHNADKAKINLRNTMTADGKDVKAVIAAGLKLSERGKKMIKQKMSDKDTEKQIEKGIGGWIWEHSDAHSGTDYEYVAEGE